MDTYMRAKTNVELRNEAYDRYKKAVDFLELITSQVDQGEISWATGSSGIGSLRMNYLELEKCMLADNDMAVVQGCATLIRTCLNIAAWHKHCKERCSQPFCV